MKRIFSITILGSLILLFCLFAAGQKTNTVLKLLSVQKIWDKAPHNAFTDLIRFHDRWFCVFREADSHTSKNGSLRIITSVDGNIWDSAALVTSTNSDLRDAKITITPDDRLMLSGAEAFHNKSVHTHQSLVWLSDDGYNWSEKYEIGNPDFWLWRTSWHKGIALNFGYACGDEKSLRLYQSKDGKVFSTLISDLRIDGYPNETSIVFKGDSAFCLLRRDAEKNTALIGVSIPPFTSWKWKDLGVRIGGPQMYVLHDGKFLATVRLYESDGWHPARTSLCWVNPYSGILTEALKLPSGGDTSYAGMVLFENVLWVSYYSSHEEKTAIYLAKVAIENQP